VQEKIRKPLKSIFEPWHYTLTNTTTPTHPTNHHFPHKPTTHRPRQPIPPNSITQSNHLPTATITQSSAHNTPPATPCAPSTTLVFRLSQELCCIIDFLEAELLLCRGGRRSCRGAVTGRCGCLWRGPCRVRRLGYTSLSEILWGVTNAVKTWFPTNTETSDYSTVECCTTRLRLSLKLAVVFDILRNTSEFCE